MSEIRNNEKNDRWTPQKLHSRIFILELVTFLSLVLNLALWFFAGNLNSKVNQTEQTVQTQR
jgi:regulatory protein YycH of two-component signal transduction system YycFG